MNQVRLGDLAELTVGFVGSMTPHYREAGVPFLRSQNIRPFRIDGTDLRYVTDEFDRRHGKSRLYCGDVAIVRTGMPGTAAVVTKEWDGANCSDLVIVRPSKRLDSKWLAYFINYRVDVIRANHSHGAVQQHFNVRVASDLEIPALSIEEQRRISAVLGALDDKIAANSSLVSAIDVWSSALFDQARANTPRLPVRDVAELVLGGTPSRSNPDFWGGPIPWINSGACNQQIITAPSEFITEEGLQRSAAKTLARGTTVVAITGATLGQMAWLGYPMAANQSVVGVVNSETPAWVHYAMRAETQQLLNWATGGAQQHVNKIAVGSILVAFEKLAAQAFEASVAPLLHRATQAQKENTTLAATRDELLPLLMSGKITVKDAEKRVEEKV